MKKMKYLYINVFLILPSIYIISVQSFKSMINTI